MKSIKNLLLIFLLVVFLSSDVLAAGDIQVVLEQPAVYSVKKDDNLDYKVAIKMPEDYEKNFNSFAVTVMMDEKLDILQNSVVGAEIQDGKLEVKTSKLSKSQNIVSISVSDLSALKGAKEFSVNIKTRVNTDSQGDNALQNSFVLTSVKSDGTENSSQKNLTSNTQSEDGNIVVNPINTASKQIVGRTTPGASVVIEVNGDQIAKTTAAEDGLFSTDIESLNEGAIVRVSSTFGTGENKKTITNRTIVEAEDKSESVINDTSKSISLDSKLKDYINFSRDINVSKANKEDAARLVAAIANAQFIDVKSDVTDSEIEDAIEKIEDAAKYVRTPFMNGISEDKFAPSAQINRAEIAMILSRLDLGKDPSGYYSEFSDVDQKKWYADAVGYAKSEGYMSGYSDGKFLPEKPITRAEFASVITKFIGESSRKSHIEYVDVSEDFWARDAIAIMSEKGYMNGKEESKFEPDVPISRAEVAKVVNAVLERVPNKDFMDKYSQNPFEDLDRDFWGYYEVLEATGN